MIDLATHRLYFNSNHLNFCAPLDVSDCYLQVSYKRDQVYLLTPSETLKDHKENSTFKDVLNPNEDSTFKDVLSRPLFKQ